MKNHLTLEITQEDIDEGLTGDNQSCPVALAAKRVFPSNSVTANTKNLTVMSLHPFRQHFYIYPQDLASFVWRFDTHNPVEPGTFELTLK